MEAVYATGFYLLNRRCMDYDLVKGNMMSEIQDRYELIAELTPGWRIARDAADRDSRMNAKLNMFAKDAFAPINRLLDEVLELRLLEGVDGAEATS